MRKHGYRRVAVAAALTRLVASAAALASAPAALAASVSPVVERSSSSVTADALPTVQIDGVVWSQALVGNAVYAGGSFANARPAGAASGTNLTARNDLLSYNLSTGALNTSSAPNLNAQVKAVAASPDGSRVYVGGSFTTADGQNRYRLAAYSTSTGALISSFVPTLDATVNSITATDSTVYIGGLFGVARSRLAAFSATTGALLAWNPTAKINGSTAYGLGSVDATTGASIAFAANQVVQDSGSSSAVVSLSTDGTSIYGTGYVYSSGGNFEGVFLGRPRFRQDQLAGRLPRRQLRAFGSGSQVYVVSHEHDCANIGGFPDTDPRTAYFRSTAFTMNATGTVQTNGESGGGYGNVAGQPSPSLTSWYPTIDTRTYTGQSQGAWAVTGNSQYVVEGGEFLHVNGTAQQGLVRFAVDSLAPKKRDRRIRRRPSHPKVTASSGGTATVTWPTNWEQDNNTLTYAHYRDDNATTPLTTVTAASTPWNRPTLTFHDSGLTSGKTYLYWVRATDASGNAVRSPNTSVVGQ